MKLPIKYGRYLPKYKHNALIFIVAFRLRLKVPHSMTELIRNIDIMEEYKISICVLLLHLLLNIERKKTDLNEISVLINCIKRTVPPIVERRRSIIHYLDKVYNELKSGENQNNQGNNEERNNV